MANPMCSSFSLGLICLSLLMFVSFLVDGLDDLWGSSINLFDGLPWRYGPRCKERRQASKKLDIWRLPDVLVIHLKRFPHSRSMKHKLETLVNFPIHGFDLTNYVANKKNPRPLLYELYALTNHYGGMGSGHYTAHIKVVQLRRQPYFSHK